MAGAAFAVLPGAGRVWKAVRAEPVLVPFWVQTIKYSTYLNEDYVLWLEERVRKISDDIIKQTGIPAADVAWSRVHDLARGRTALEGRAPSAS